MGMTDEQLAFERAIMADPTDHTTRLVYCDWLDERGLLPDYSAFLRRGNIVAIGQVVYVAQFRPAPTDRLPYRGYETIRKAGLSLANEFKKLNKWWEPYWTTLLAGRTPTQEAKPDILDQSSRNQKGVSSGNTTDEGR